MTPRIRPKMLAALALSTLAVLTTVAHAQPATWPTKPIKYVVPFSPGGVSDGVARLVAQHLGERLGQPVIIDNRPGVSGIVGTQAVARAPADGYTVMGGTITTHAVNPFFNKNLGYDPVKDFVPVNLVGMVSNVLVVPEGSRFNSVAQVVAELKASPTASPTARPARAPRSTCRASCSRTSRTRACGRSSTRAARRPSSTWSAGRSTWCSRPWPPRGP
jgi:tripartite-type tricarboxylate transporter receptor subunit TctC